MKKKRKKKVSVSEKKISAPIPIPIVSAILSADTEFRSDTTTGVFILHEIRSISEEKCQPFGRRYSADQISGSLHKDKHRSRARTPFNITGFPGGGLTNLLKTSVHLEEYCFNGCYYFFR